MSTVGWSLVVLRRRVTLRTARLSGLACVNAGDDGLGLHQTLRLMAAGAMFTGPIVVTNKGINAPGSATSGPRVHL